MTTKQPKSLYKQQQANVPIAWVFIASFLFALIFFVLGSVFRYYPVIGA